MDVFCSLLVLFLIKTTLVEGNQKLFGGGIRSSSWRLDWGDRRAHGTERITVTLGCITCCARKNYKLLKLLIIPRFSEEKIFPFCRNFFTRLGKLAPTIIGLFLAQHSRVVSVFHPPHGYRYLWGG
jgi:hypothetical protein